MNDLLDSTGNLISYQCFCCMYGQICDFLHFNQLLSAIPTNWKRKLKKDGNRSVHLIQEVRNTTK